MKNDDGIFFNYYFNLRVSALSTVFLFNPGT